jgi:hypothetical protein
MFRKFLGFREREIIPHNNTVGIYHVTFMVGEGHGSHDADLKPDKHAKAFSRTALNVTGAEFNMLMQEASQYLLVRAAELKDNR